MKRVNITIPEQEHDEALKRLPYDGIETFSVLVRHALKKQRWTPSFGQKSGLP